MPEETARILVVDDNNLIRDMLVSRINHREAYEAVPAGDGLVALEKISQETFDLILLDIMMPEMDGYQVLQKLAEQKNQTPVVVMSALDDVDGVIRCMNLGADDYLRKPVKQELLWSRLAASIEKKQLRDRERSRVAELSLLQKIDRDLNQTLDLHEISQLTLHYARQQTAASCGMVGFVLDDRVKVIAAEGLSPAYELPLIIPFITADAPQQRPLTDSDRPESSATYRITIPIQRNSTLHMAMLLDTNEVCAQETMDFLVRLANHAAIALHNAQLYQDAHMANRAKTNFVGMVSHELKNPLQAIVSYVDLVKRSDNGGLTERQLNYLEIITSSGKRIQNLAHELDDITRVETGNIKLSFEAFPLSEALAQVLDLLQQKISEKEQTLQTAVAPNLPAVWADRQRLEQILLNLISNACKYTPNGGKVEISAVLVEDSSKPKVRVSVTDNGIGISEIEQGQIFSQFFRADDPQVRAEHGTGLGLHITRKLVTLHGGEIDFHSAVGQGTTFCFTLPTAVADEAADLRDK